MIGTVLSFQWNSRNTHSQILKCYTFYVLLKAIEINHWYKLLIIDFFDQVRRGRSSPFVSARLSWSSPSPGWRATCCTAGNDPVLTSTRPGPGHTRRSCWGKRKMASPSSGRSLSASHPPCVARRTKSEKVWSAALRLPLRGPHLAVKSLTNDLQTSAFSIRPGSIRRRASRAADARRSWSPPTWPSHRRRRNRKLPASWHTARPTPRRTPPSRTPCRTPFLTRWAFRLNNL